MVTSTLRNVVFKKSVKRDEKEVATDVERKQKD